MRRAHRLAPLALAALSAAWGCSGGGEAPSAPAPEGRPAARPRAPSGPAVEHAVRFPEAAAHHVEVTSVFPTGGAGELVLFMPVWTPGSYLVREHSRNVERIEATTMEGAPLHIDKTRKNRWTVATGGADHVVVRLDIYAREPNVRASFVDADVAVLNGATLFLCPLGDTARPHHVEIEPSEAWPDVATALPLGEGPHAFVAASYDELVDSPIVLGDGEPRTFDAGGARWELWTFGASDRFEHDRVAADLERLVTEQVAFWGNAPFTRYVVLNVATGPAGGLEHAASTLLMVDPFAAHDDETRKTWLALASHEIFHAWNGKRLRPEALGPFDYENEAYTESLWLVEGFTSYYGDLILRRAGLVDDERYLGTIAEAIDGIERTPGRRVQSLSSASYDAWIKYYRPDENARNATVSYYGKGLLVAFLLDAEIRAASGGVRSLDDFMRLALARHGGEHGYTDADLRVLASEVAGHDMSPFFDRFVDGTEELDYTTALDTLGLLLREPDDDETEGDPDPGWLGAETELDDGRFVVTEVLRDTPAHAAGLDVGDELIAVGEFRVTDPGVAAALAPYGPGETVTLLVARRERLRRISVELGEPPAPPRELVFDDSVVGGTRRTRTAWLASSVSPPGASSPRRATPGGAPTAAPPPQ